MANGNRNSSSVGGTTRKINTKKVNAELNKRQGGNSQNRSNANRSNSAKSSQGRSTKSSSSQQRSSQGRTSSQTRSGQNTSTKNRAKSSANVSMKSAALKKRKQQRAKRIMIVLELVIVLCLVLVGVGLLYKDRANRTPQEEVVEEEPKTTASIVDGIDISTMSRSEIKDTLMKKYNWGMTVVLDDKIYEVENYIEKSIDGALADAYSSFFPGTYSIELTDIEGIADEVARKVDETWSQPAKNAMITSYNSDTGEFMYDEGQPGYAIDKTALAEDIRSALEAKQYGTQIQASVSNNTTDITVADYELIGTYSTKTTANENRNTNIRVASSHVNGTVLQPGEQFSYNQCLGKRTAEGGYKEAPAYANGEHVMEYGGGICQLSSTMYNAIIAANIQVDKRTGHTYEPSYVTPGEDAAVSYMNPDFVFTNNTKGSLGIKVTFEDRTIIVKVYGIRTLEEGVKRYLKSEKVGDVPPPPDVMVEDPAVPFGQSQVVHYPKNGSKWSTNIILEKDGQVISDEYLHTTTYRGSAAEIHVNTLSPTPQPAPPPVEEQPAEQPPAEQPAEAPAQ